MNLTRKKQFFDETVSQWSMIRALAFAERDWIVSVMIIFSVSDVFVFLGFAGVASTIFGVLFIAPVLSLGMHATQKYFYRRMKEKKNTHVTMRDLKRMSWKANLIWFPVIFGACWLTIGLFFDMRAEFLLALGLKP
jgi:hypothetical protein